GDGHTAAAGRTSGLEAGERPLAYQVTDAVRHDSRQAGLKPPEWMAGEIQAERLALAREPHRLAPFRRRPGTDGWGRGGRLIAGQPEQVVLPRIARAAALGA